MIRSTLGGNGMEENGANKFIGKNRTKTHAALHGPQLDAVGMVGTSP